jgi:hypothetical protein
LYCDAESKHLVGDDFAVVDYYFVSETQLLRRPNLAAGKGFDYYSPKG